MNKSNELIEEFLNDMLEASHLGVKITPKMINCNLTKMGISLEKSLDIKHIFELWVNHFKEDQETIAYVDPASNYYCWFKSPGNTDPDVDKMIKMYIPLDEAHLAKGVEKIFEFISSKKIVHTSKVASEVRYDDVVIRVFSMDDALKIQNFIMNDEYLKEGIMKPNSFTFSNGYISYTWDGHLSYNLIVSEYISGYINSIKNLKTEATYKGFLEFVTSTYNKIFVDGKDPLRYIDMDETSIKYIDDYKRASEMLLMALTSEDKDVDDFNYYYNKIIYDKDIKQKKGLTEYQGLFDRVYQAMVMKDGYKATDERILSFIYANDYKFFTNANGIRSFMIDNNITPESIVLLFNGMKEKQEKERILSKGLKITYKKYDYEQVKQALKHAIEADYKYFSNDDECRTRLIHNVNKDEIYGLMAFKLLNMGYFIEDVFVGKEALSNLYLDVVLNINKKSEAKET